ncbi:MAG: cytochrome c4 [Nevskia sp.]|nr:cytochrome c4 [Nevskia sp.]
MKRVVIALAILLAPLIAGAESAAPAAATAETAKADPFTGSDPAAGAAKAPACYACHGPGGNGGVNPLWPKLAGQHSAYIHEQLAAFKCGNLPADQRAAAKCSDVRSNPVMGAQAANLSDQDARDLAAYFATQKPVPGLGKKETAALGEKLYRAGDASRGLPACAACHGPSGAGNAAAQFPRIGGQNTDYAAAELKLYRSCGANNFQNCDRGGASKAQMMSTVAAKLSDAEIDALAAYLTGLQ